MKTYQNLRQNRIEWIPTLPEHWNCVKINNLFSERIRKVSDVDFSPLSVTKTGIVPQLSTAAKSSDNDNRKLVCVGDFVINSRSDRKGSCGVSDLEGSVSTVNIVLKLKQSLNSRYIHYLLRSHPFSEEFYKHGRGIVSDLWSTRFREMKNILLPIPPRSEQDQIVRFLDWKTSEINFIISRKQKQILLLKDYMHAKIESILHSYPANKTARLKELGTFYKGGGFSRDNLTKQQEYPAILYGDIYTQYEYKTETINSYIDYHAYTSSRKILQGDIVMAGTGETKEDIGKSILYTGNKAVAIGGDVIAFHPNEEVDAEYLLYQLYSKDTLNYRYINSKGDIIVHIYPITLGNILIPFPDKTKQKFISEKINEIINRMKQAVKILTAEISVLREYKSCLISDAVTAQIDVRDIEIPIYEYAEELPEPYYDDVVYELGNMENEEE